MQKYELDLYINFNNTFECGQCFRWKKIHDDKYVGVVCGGVAVVENLGNNKISIEDSLDVRGIQFWEKYFSAELDLIELEKIFSKIDNHVKKAVEYSPGLRILSQEPFETILSFIISSNNNIKRITSIIDRISRKYGKFIMNYEGTDYYSFPSVENLLDVSVKDFRDIGLGYRDKYIFDACLKISKNEVNLNLYDVDTNSAIEELSKIKGIGLKVASCILLFSYSKYDSFPIDTWIKKVLDMLYAQELDKYDSVEKFFSGYFGDYPGIAQQYLFNYMRKTYKIK